MKNICNNCGNTEFIISTINKAFNIDGKLVLVENIPALICTQCHEPLITSETVEYIRNMIHSGSKPKEVVSTEVYEYA
jgi:YgiT-type zinc finger domain-containing protein